MQYKHHNYHQSKGNKMKHTHLVIKYTNGEVARLPVKNETTWRQNHLQKIWSAQANVASAKLESPNDLVQNPRFGA